MTHASPEIPIGKRSDAMRAWMLGESRVSVGARTIVDEKWRLRKAAALVKILALAPGYRIHRERAMDLLWPHLGRGAAANNLRQAVYAARRIISPTGGSGYLASDGQSLVLCSGGDEARARRASPWRWHVTWWVPTPTGCGSWSWLEHRSPGWCPRR